MFQSVAFVSFQKDRVDAHPVHKHYHTLPCTSGDFLRGISQSWGEHNLLPKLRYFCYIAGTSRT